MKYDAFISYRHTPLDMEIAKKLHRSLETFPIPLAVQKKTGKKKIRRVFRDQEELPIGSNLTDKINAALKETEYEAFAAEYASDERSGVAKLCANALKKAEALEAEKRRIDALWTYERQYPDCQFICISNNSRILPITMKPK